MPNTNFQTIHQFGAGISQVVRQATGRDPVQTIEMEHVTVAQAKRLRIVDTFTGNPVTFTAGKDSFIGAEVGMNVKQNLNGQHYPWPAGCGSNLIPDETHQGRGYVSGSFLRSNGITVQAPTYAISEYFAVNPDTDYTWGEGLDTTETDSNLIAMCFYDENYEYVTGFSMNLVPNHTVHAPNNAVYARSTIKRFTPYLQMTIGSTVLPYTPYSNICPISPWESVLITVNDEDHLTNFPQPVYVGSFNTLTGELIITDAITTVGTYSWAKLTQNRFQTTIPGIKIGPTSPYQTPLSCSAYRAIIAVPPITPPVNYPDFSIWTNGGSHNNVVIRDSRFETAAQFKTAMADTQICYPLQYPLILQLTKEEIPAAEGENTVSTNADTLTVTLYEAV